MTHTSPGREQAPRDAGTDNGRAHRSESDPVPNDTPGSHAALLAEAATGSERAWRSLLDLYGRRVYALARSRLRNHDHAEEITQSVFVTVSTKLRDGEYVESGRFEPWLFRIAVNRIRDEIRRQRRQFDAIGSGAGETDLASPHTVGSEAGVTAAIGDELIRLRDALENLSPADREVVELRHHAGMSFKQMADLLDEPVGTLLARHHRALRKLRDTLTETPHTDAGDNDPALTRQDHGGTR